MASFRVLSAALFGLSATPITVEADISSGLPKFHIVGLPDTAVSEARERVRAAIKNSNFSFPRTNIIVNLAPADTRKQGPSYDVAIALAILAAQHSLNTPHLLDRLVVLGELSLTGEIRPIRGILLIAAMAKKHGFLGIIVPPENVQEAQLVEGINVYSAPSLLALVHTLEQPILSPAPPMPPSERPVFEQNSYEDFSLIAGQRQAKRALEIAAAGGHNVLLSGPPGSGKTMLARAFAGILPPPSPEESLEITAIHSVAGLLREPRHLHERPFRAPHHTSSGVALVGGGTNPRPGEISLAHRGVLFLDEFPEFSRSVLENLRQPLEDGTITVCRALGTVMFPARFMLIASMNPCPCGFMNDAAGQCLCTPQSLTRYHQKISGPLLDRIDLRVEVPRLTFDELTATGHGESSCVIRERVTAIRSLTRTRYATSDILTNTELKARHIKLWCNVDKNAMELLKSAVNRLRMSARSYGRVLKVSRTIADLAHQENITIEHIAEALQYRLITV